MENNRTVIRIEFDIPVPDGSTYDEIREWAQFNLCGGSIKNDLLQRMGDWEPDAFSLNIEF